MVKVAKLISLMTLNDSHFVLDCKNIYSEINKKNITENSWRQLILQSQSHKAIWAIRSISQGQQHFSEWKEITSIQVKNSWCSSFVFLAGTFSQLTGMHTDKTLRAADQPTGPVVC